jgi:iron complex outermembrane receptor protein
VLRKKQVSGWWAAGAMALLGSATATAQDGGPGDPDGAAREPRAAQRVEITGRQSETNLRRAANVAKQIYGREELDRFGDTNVLDVLRRLPGVNVSSGGPRMRGLGAGYTQLLINGDPAPPGFSLDQLSPSQVERIEVLRAPTADQSAQAIAGTLNVVLKEPPRRSEKQLRLGLTQGTKRPMGNLNLTFSESRSPLAATVPFSLFEWDRESSLDKEDLSVGTDGLPALAQQEGRQHSWGWGFNLGPRLNWRFSDDNTLSVQTFAQKGWWNNRLTFENRVLSGQPNLEDDSDRDGTWQNLRANLTWAYRFADDQRIELRAGARQSKGTYDLRDLYQGAVSQQTVGSNRDVGVSQAGKYSTLLGETHSLTLGWDLEAREREERREVTRDGVSVLPDYDGQPFDADVRRVAFYVQDEWELSPNWQMYLGLRHESIRTASRGQDEAVSNTSRVLSPLMHLTWRMDPKSRDLVRASLTRSYKAPGLSSLLARPSVNSAYADTSVSNTALAADRIGNPLLRPELATGLDVAYEKYLPAGGLMSVGVFHRRITDVVRTVTSLQSVPWASAPRWVAQPQNFSSALTSGLELELKGRASELLPELLPQLSNLNLRGSLNIYRSRLAVLPGPNNRLDGQQPWSATLGFDQRIQGLPLMWGGSFNYTPAYETQLAEDRLEQRSPVRSLDLFAQWTVRQGLSVRLAGSAGVQPFGPPNGSTRTVLSSGDYSLQDRESRPQLNISVDMRL